jgi:transposase
LLKLFYKLIITIVEKTVSGLKKPADNLQKLIADKIKSAPSLHSKVSRLQEVQGIGEITASSLLSLMLELGSLSDTQAASLAGVALFKHDSGQFLGQRHIRGGLSQFRSVVDMSALVAFPSSKTFTNACLPQENQKNSLSPLLGENSLPSPTAS